MPTITKQLERMGLHNAARSLQCCEARAPRSTAAPGMQLGSQQTQVLPAPKFHVIRASLQEDLGSGMRLLDLEQLQMETHTAATALAQKEADKATLQAARRQAVQVCVLSGPSLVMLHAGSARTGCTPPSRPADCMQQASSECSCECRR